MSEENTAPEGAQESIEEPITPVEEAAQEVYDYKAPEKGDQSPDSFYDRLLGGLGEEEEIEEAPAAEPEVEAKAEEQDDKKEELKALDEAQMDALVTMKVDGEELQMPLKEALRISGLDRASHKRMREAKDLAEKAQGEGERMLSWARQNPEVFMEKALGIDPVGFAEHIVDKVLQMEEMSPEERRAWQLEQENQQLKQSNEQAKQRVSQSEIENEKAKITQEINGAMQAVGVDPSDQEFFRSVAQEMHRASLDKKNLTASEAASNVKNRHLESIKKTLSSADEAMLEQVLGPEIARKLQEASVKRVTQRASDKITQSSSNSPGKEPASVKRNRRKRPTFQSEADYQAFAERLKAKY